MKIYAAIGHFKGKKHITSIVLMQNTKADFLADCYGNAFVPYVVMTEKVMGKIFHDAANGVDVYAQVKKMTTNYRVWNEVTDFITDAGYLVTDQVDEIKANQTV